MKRQDGISGSVLAWDLVSSICRIVFSGFVLDLTTECSGRRRSREQWRRLMLSCWRSAAGSEMNERAWVCRGDKNARHLSVF